MWHGWPQGLAVAALRRVKPDLERHHARVLQQDAKGLFDDHRVRQQIKSVLPLRLAAFVPEPRRIEAKSVDRYLTNRR